MTIPAERLDQLEQEADNDIGEVYTDVDARNLKLLIAEARRVAELEQQLSSERRKSQNIEHGYDVIKFDCDQLRQALAEVKRKLPNAVTQTTPTNCFRACVATVLGLPIEDIPAACDGSTWDWGAFQTWLASRGMQAIEIGFANGGTIYPVSAPVPCIVSGSSPRECVTGRHAVVGELIGIDGFRLLHDPHPSAMWLDGEPTHATFFVPLEINRLAAVTAERDGLKTRLLSAAGDDLCRLTQDEIKAMTSGAVQIPPKEEFLASCERFHAQVAGEAGVLGSCLTLAQLIAENERLTVERDELRAELSALDDREGRCGKCGRWILEPEQEKT